MSTTACTSQCCILGQNYSRVGRSLSFNLVILLTNKETAIQQGTKKTETTGIYYWFLTQSVNLGWSIEICLSVGQCPNGFDACMNRYVRVSEHVCVFPSFDCLLKKKGRMDGYRCVQRYQLCDANWKFSRNNILHIGQCGIAKTAGGKRMSFGSHSANEATRPGTNALAYYMTVVFVLHFLSLWLPEGDLASVPDRMFCV